MPMLIDTAELAGLAAEGSLYGVFVCLFFVCGYDLVRRRARKNSQLSWPMILAGVLLILLATARFAVDTTNVFVAFVHHDPREARLAYLADVTQPLFTTKHSILIAVLLVGDSFVNYRCWVVWGKSLWIVVLPVGLSITSAVFGSYTMWAYSNLPSQTVLSEAKWLKAFFSLSLVANALATSMLAVRIWSVDRETKNAMPEHLNEDSTLMPVVRIILESGLINAAYLFVYVMTLEFGSQGLEIMSEMATPLTGIIFSIVILRVGRRRHDDSYYTQRISTLSWVAGKKSKRSDMTTETDATIGNPNSSNLELYDMHGSTTTKGNKAEHDVSTIMFSNAV